MIEPDFARGVRMRAFFVPLIAAALATGCGRISPQPDDLMASAREQAAAGHHRAAIIELRNVLQQSSRHAEALYWLGLEYSRTGDYAAAIRPLQRALDLGYDAAKAIPPLSKSLIATGDYQRALDRAMVDLHGDNRTQAEIYALRGLAYLGLKRNREASDSFVQALAFEPEFADALRGQARMAADDKDFDQALRLLGRATASAPDDVESWLLKGDLLRHTKQKGALAAYRKVLEIDPENVLGRLDVVSILIAEGQVDAAGKEFEPARMLAPNAPRVQYVEGLLAYYRGEYSAARVAARQVLEALPDHMPSVVLAGAAAYELGEYIEAQGYLARIVDKAPDDMNVRILLATAYARAGNPGRALDALSQPLAQVPVETRVLTLAGEFAMQNNEPLKASDYFERATKADPGSASARTALAASRMAWGETDRALADLEAAARLDPQNYHADIVLSMSQLQLHKYDGALKALQVLEKKQPTNPLTHNLKAAALLGKGDSASARKALERALELQPTYLPATINLAKLDVVEKNPRAARKRLETALQGDENNAQTLMALADSAPQIGASPRERIDWLERATHAHPDLARPKLMLARHYAQRGDHARANDLVQQVLTRDPKNADALDMLGEIQLLTGYPKDALQTFGKLVALQGKSPVARYRLASAQTLNRDYADASRSLRTALSLKPDYVDAQVALIRLEILLGRYDEAKSIAQRIQQQPPRSPLGYMMEGDVLMAEKKFVPAAKAFEAGYAVEKSGALAIKIHAAYAEAGKPDDGDARLKQWLGIAPEDAFARMYSADADLRQGKYRNAVEQYEWLAQNDPKNVTVLNNLAWTYDQLGDARALAMAERAYRIKPDDPAITDTLGWLLVRQGDANRGVELLQKAVEATPNVQEIRFHLAKGWVKIGDPAKARGELDRLLAPGSPFSGKAEAAATLEQLGK